MQTAVSPHTGVVTPLGVAVGMFVAVGAHDARPTLAIGATDDQAILGQPRKDVVGAVILYLDRPVCVGFNFTRHDTKRVHNLRQAKLTLGVKLGQDRGKFVALGLEVDATRYPKISHRITRAFIGVPSLGD